MENCYVSRQLKPAATPYQLNGRLYLLMRQNIEVSKEKMNYEIGEE